MRNLKKTLCLVLALVFVLGLCTVGAADLTYTDAADITAEYEGAIKAMSGLGILKGYGDGSFKPDQEVTRGEAAKIIAYICLGAENADKYPARDVFSDVKATDWYAPYVGYCVNNGIINGKGNNTFAPKDPVKQVELAKMLLAACGYGAKDEFVGKDWDFNVVERAIKTGIAKKLLGTDLNWDAAATREITSVMAYATMMKVNQVEVSKDTNAYVDLAGANGVDVGTFAEATWGLDTVTGVVRYNKANKDVAGTQLTGMSKTVWDSDGNAVTTFSTDDDAEAGLLGHRVSIQFREEETTDGKLYMKAYFVEDQSTEKAPAEVVGKTGATVYDCFNGTLGAGGTTAPANALPATLAAYAGGTFVLDADGSLLTYKENDFVVETLTVTKGVGTTATYTTGITTIPANAKTGDIVCVYKCGDFTEAKAATSAEVLISQSQAGTYNNGAIHATAANGANNLVSVVGVFTKYAGALDVGKTYTLWYDCEGGTVAFKEKAGPAAAAKDYYLLMNGRQVATDPYDTTVKTNYAQLMKPDGTIVEQIVENDMSGAVAKAVVYLDDINNNTILELQAVGAGDPVASGVAYAPSAVVIFDNASFVAYTGTGSGLKVASTTDKPDAGKTVYYIYETVGAATSGDSTVAIQKVKSVWFDIADKYTAPATEVKGSYIYVSGTASTETKLVGSAVKYFFPGYKDGVVMDDLYFKADTAQTVGFYTYKDATAASGDRYALTAVAGLTGTGTGVVTTTLKKTANVASDSFIVNGKLYVNGSALGIDLSAVKVVILPTAGAPATMEASVAGILATVASKDVTITFVETLTATSAACTSGVIYVTAVAA